MNVRMFALVGTAGLALGAGACVDTSADSGLRILANAFPGDGCVIDPSVTSFQDDGLIDSNSFDGYLFTPIVTNDLVTIGDPRLKSPTSEIEAGEAQELLTTLTARLRELNGAGLAAPQIGVSVRAAIVEVRRTDVFPDRPETGLIQILNPTVLERTAETVLDW